MLTTVRHGSWPTLSHGPAGSRSADYAKAVPPQLYSGCMARQDEDTVLYKELRFSFPFLAPLYTDTSAELGHQYSPDLTHDPLFWAKSCDEASALVCL